MNCFYHQETVAVGICKSCSKGICPVCAVDVGNGLACRGRCEAEVKAVNELIGGNIKRSSVSREIIDSARRMRYFGASFYLLFGLFFIGFFIYRMLFQTLQSPDYLFVGMGALFILFGLVALNNARRIK